MRKKIQKILSLMLSVIMLCSMMPTAVSAAITEYEEYTYGVESFEDLKEVAGYTYPEDAWVSVYYSADEPMIIRENLTLPETVHLYWHEAEVVIPAGVTFSVSGYIYFNKLTVEGTLVNNLEVSVENGLVINGSLENNGLLRPGAGCEMSGLQNVVDTMYGEVMIARCFSDFGQLKEQIAMAAEYPEYVFEIYADPEPETLEVHITENLTVPDNVWLEGSDNFTLIVDEGCTLINDGLIDYLGAALVVNGSIENRNTIYLAWLCYEGEEYVYGSLVIAPGGTYSGYGFIALSGGENLDRTDYREFLTGLDLTPYRVDTYFDQETQSYYWELIHKDWQEPDPEPDMTVGGFTDVSYEDYYAEPVLWAVEAGITNGYGSEDTFCPEVKCTRGQVVTFLWRAAGSPEPASLENPFTDVASAAYYYKAVLWAVENGITAGYGSDTIFNPEGVCNRAQVATFMWRAAGKPGMSGVENKFTDVADDAYYYDAVLWAVENGITNGYGSDTIFNPDGDCTRGQIVTFLFRGIV